MIRGRRREVLMKWRCFDKDPRVSEDAWDIVGV